MTIQQQYDATARADLLGRPLFAVLVVIAYGIYRLWQEGIAPAGWPNGSVLVFGGIVSAAFIVVYMRILEKGSGKSFGKALGALGGLIPYVYSLYVIGYVGIWSLVQLFTVGFTWTGLIVGIVFALLGYRILFTFWQITEIGEGLRVSETA